jgi:hypothetical protein
MKKILFVGVCLLVMSVTTFGTINFKLWSGFTTVSMAEVNKESDSLYDNFKNLKDFIETNGGTATLDYSKLGYGIVVGGDLGFEVISGLSIGPRIEYIYCFPLKLNLKGEILGTTVVDGEFTVNASLIPVMFGGVYSVSLMDNLFLDVDLYLGWAFASASSISQDKLSGTSQEIPMAGSGFAADIAIGIRNEFTKGVGVGFNVGYRYAKIPEMKATKDVDSGVKAGDVIKDSQGNPLPFDFSGFNFAISFNVAF